MGQTWCEPVGTMGQPRGNSGANLRSVPECSETAGRQCRGSRETPGRRQLGDSRQLTTGRQQTAGEQGSDGRDAQGKQQGEDNERAGDGRERAGRQVGRSDPTLPRPELAAGDVDPAAARGRALAGCLQNWAR